MYRAPSGPGVLAWRLQHATIVARDVTWKITDGFEDATRAKVR
jgi:hypothetical protein